MLYIFQFVGKKQILEENLAKRPCNRFLSTGTCPFGDQCKYRHIRNEDIERMKAEAGNLVIIYTVFKFLKIGYLLYSI